MHFDRRTWRGTRQGMWLALGLALAGCATVPKVSTKPEPAGPPPTVEEVLAKIERDVDAEVKAKHWPDLAIGVVADGKLRWWKGYGEVDSQTHAPVTDKSYFRYGSITKTFTGLALLQLRDAGKLSLDDPLEKFIPEVKEVIYPTAERSPIRLRHLVTHTSALPRVPTGIDYTNPKHLLTEGELLAVLPDLTLDGTPGAFEGYSNYANCLSGVVVHRVSGMSYDDYVSTRIARPLGLRLRFRLQDVPPGSMATGHEVGPPAKEVLGSWELGACNSAGGLFGSLADLAGYAAFELAAWPPRNAAESPVASRATLRESQTAHGGGFGVNWVLEDDKTLGRVVWHNGAVAAGYVAELFMLPERGVGVVALMGGEAEGELQHLVRASLGELEQAYGRRTLEPTPAMRSKIDQVLGLLEPDAGPAPDGLFTAEFVAEVHPDKAGEMLSILRERGGRCHLAKVLWANANAAKVSVACARGAMDLTFYLETRPPRAIAGFWYHLP